MADHRIGTREEWQAARDELQKLETEQGERNAEIRRKRRELPWVPVEKGYVFDTEDGKKTLAELFDGRSQLLGCNVMYGPDYEMPRVHEPRRLLQRDDGSPPQQGRRDPALLLAGADRPAGGLQAANGLAGSLRSRRMSPTFPGTSGSH